MPRIRTIKPELFPTREQRFAARMWALKKQKNSGRMKRMLIEWPGVRRLTVSSGGQAPCFCAVGVELYDGAEITAYGRMFQKRKALLMAALRAAKYLCGRSTA